MVPEVVAKAFKEREDSVLKKILEYDIEFLEIGIFGSYARGDYKAISDIDFLVIMETDDSIPRNVVCELYDKAEEWKVDIRFVTKEYFNHDVSAFAKALRRDYRRLCYGKR